jgi:hypothetical protein
MHEQPGKTPCRGYPGNNAKTINRDSQAVRVWTAEDTGKQACFGLASFLLIATNRVFR